MCKDKSLTYLNDLGFNVVRVPKEGIEPLQVIVKANGNLERLGPLSHFVVEDVKPPKIDDNNKAANILGKRTDKFDLSLGLNFLERFLKLLGFGGLGIDAFYKDADTIQFEFKNVLSDSILLTTVDKYLRKATPKVATLLIESIDDDGEAYVINEIIKSDTFGVIAYDSKGAEIGIDTEALNQIVDATTELSINIEAEKLINYKGSKHLPFGFKAFPFWIEIKDGTGKFKLKPPGGPIGALKFVPPEEISPDEPTPILFGRDTLINLK